MNTMIVDISGLVSHSAQGKGKITGDAWIALSFLFLQDRLTHNTDPDVIAGFQCFHGMIYD